MTIEGVDDNRDFLAMHEAMGMLGISDHQKTDIFTVLAAILHLGNIQLIENDGESCDIDVRMYHQYCSLTDVHKPVNQLFLHKPVMTSCCLNNQLVPINV